MIRIGEYPYIDGRTAAALDGLESNRRIGSVSYHRTLLSIGHATAGNVGPTANLKRTHAAVHWPIKPLGAISRNHLDMVRFIPPEDDAENPVHMLQRFVLGARIGDVALAHSLADTADARAWLDNEYAGRRENAAFLKCNVLDIPIGVLQVSEIAGGRDDGARAAHLLHPDFASPLTVLEAFKASVGLIPGSRPA